MSSDGAALARSLRELSDEFTLTVEGQPLARQLGTVISAAVELLEVRALGVLLLDDADRIRSVASTGPAAAVLEDAQEALHVGPGVDALRDARTVAVADLSTCREYASLWQRVAGAGVRAVLSSPVWAGRQLIGNINAVDDSPREWTDAQTQGSEALAGIVGELLRLGSVASRMPLVPDGPVRYQWREDEHGSED